MISVKELSKSYGKIKALNKVSLEFSGGVAGLIGPNGAGKTTLIRILVGLARQDSGRAYLFGVEAWKDRNILRKVGVLHEKPRPPSWTSGRRFLEHICRIKGIDDANSQIERVSEMLDLRYMDRPISSYSAGMIQRLSAAACLIGDPELVIMDEPTANLDPMGRLKLLKVITNFRKRGTSFFISSHILPELERVCDHIFFLNNGKLVMEGSLDRLRDLGSFILSFSWEEAPDLLNILKEKFQVEIMDKTVLIRFKDLNGLMREISEYVLKGGRVPKDLEIRPPTLEELFLISGGGANDEVA